MSDVSHLMRRRLRVLHYDAEYVEALHHERADVHEEPAQAARRRSARAMELACLDDADL